MLSVTDECIVAAFPCNPTSNNSHGTSKDYDKNMPHGKRAHQLDQQVLEELLP
jgi:hypothetical protein